jgi:hypothetical protein
MQDEIYRFGWDISSSCIGCCVLDGQGELVYYTNIKLWHHPPGLLPKSHSISCGIIEIIDNVRINIGCDKNSEMHFVEKPLSQVAGRTSRNTLMLLAGVNAIACSVIIEMLDGDDSRIQYITQKQADKAVGLKFEKGKRKVESIKFVQNLYKEIQFDKNRNGVNYERGSDDIADAIVVARAAWMMAMAKEAKRNKELLN